MAKSIRSKIKRKMRAIRRVHLQDRALKKLNEVTKRLGTVQDIASVSNTTELMEEDKAEGPKLTTGKVIKKTTGHNPKWMSQRLAKKLKKCQKMLKKTRRKKAKARR
ncbi:hypothetical protein AB6A40_007285 [Gnathostoma spinigerum]|uniref:Uncharacterized protein n=1 Tax=Gnathostoma spinigerum TaxID=75299 RepID=A0ABD6ESZ0_9BILA